jgi:hypothetical protein
VWICRLPVVEDIKWFLLFLTLTMIGFGLAFYSLFRQDRDRFMDFTNIWHSLASMFSYMLAMFDYNVFYNSTNPTAAMLLFIMFEFVMNVLLFNVLIASMTNSFSKITQVSCLASQCSWSFTQLIMVIMDFPCCQFHFVTVLGWAVVVATSVLCK